MNKELYQMSCTYYSNNELYIENVSLQTIAATYGTPCYVYSRAKIENNWRLYDSAFAKLPHLICYAVKANSNLAILNILSELNAGFDIVSGGELTRVIKANGDPRKIIFSGVGKTQVEIEEAIIKNIYCIDIESELELEKIAGCAILFDKKVNIALRVNPNIDPQTHAHISTGLHENKFGIELNQVLTLAQRVKNYSHLNLIGIACHIGSQITEQKPFTKMLDYLVLLYEQLIDHAITIKHINIGGGLGIRYAKEKPPTIQEYAQLVKEKLGHLPITIIVEPGRSIVADAGILLTRVEYCKNNGAKNFAIVDAGMNDFLRPALYSAWQNILPVKKRQDEREEKYDIVGPVCESADTFGKDRTLSITTHDLLTIEQAGAYGFSMSSNYNTRLRPCEILIDGTESFLIRRRETIDDLLSLEKTLHRNRNLSTITSDTSD